MTEVSPQALPEVSVVIPTRNRANMLLRTLSAVLAQEDVDLEVIVINEASSDNTVALLDAIDDPRLHVVQHESAKGLPAARNAGMSVARGNWLAFCDDDDIWAPNKLRVQLDALRSVPGAAWCACGAIWIDTRLRYLRAYEPPPSGDIADISLSYNPLPGGGSGTIVRASAILDAGGFDTSLKWGEDWDLWTRLSLHFPIVSVNRPLVAYLVHDQNMSNHSPRFAKDVKIIESKYRDERKKRGVRLNRVLLEGSQAEIDLRAGHRGKAVGRYIRQALQGGGFSSIYRALCAIIVPNKMVDRWNARRYSSIPQDWLIEVEPWIAPLRRDAISTSSIFGHSPNTPDL